MEAVLRITAESTLKQFSRFQPDLNAPLGRWTRIARDATWQNLAEVKQAFSSADEMIVKSGRPVTIFNIKGNSYRLITAIHYKGQRIFILMLLTHAEYSKDDWKNVL